MIIKGNQTMDYVMACHECKSKFQIKILWNLAKEKNRKKFLVTTKALVDYILFGLCILSARQTSVLFLCYFRNKIF